jgi:adenylate cyclase
MGRFLKIGVLALLSLALTYALAQTRTGQSVDNFVYDQLIRLRASQKRGPSLDERILILEIDEGTRQQIKDPIALWLPLYADVLNAVYQSGASLVGFDIIPTYAPREKLLPFAQTALTHPEQLIMVSFFDFGTNTEVMPADGIRALMGDQNIGIANLNRDDDGIFRRQTFADFKLNGETRPFFTRLLYERITNKTELPDEELTNFVGPPGTLPRVSFGQVVTWIEQGDNGKLDSVFRNKIVLVGGTARVDQDFVETPFPSSQPMPGVEMHANILNTLLTEQWLVEKNQWWLFCLFLLPLSWAALERSLLWSSSLYLASSLIWLSWLYLAFLGGTVVQPLGLGLLGLLTSYVTGYLYRFNTVERERRRIRSVFGRYVSPDVMEAMLKVPEDHRPELAKRQRVTVMFSDINDFSTACEKLEPEEVTRRLNTYFGEMTNIIYQHQGTIIRFIGDEFMVLFGAPKEGEKIEEMAVLAAVRMVERLQKLKQADPTGEGGFYEVKIGIHVGEMILTSIGNEIRSDYNCIGDSTNMAARVLSLTKPLGATVLISEAVKKAVEDCPLLAFRDLGLHPVKGRAGEVRVFDTTLA